MPEPLSFKSASPRHGLPLLFAAQAQKEVVINETLLRLDTLVHCAVEDEGSTPPAVPVEGECWLVGSSAEGEWQGREGNIAAFAGGAWQFLIPTPGMTCWLVATGQSLRYDQDWTAPSLPAAPAGGAVIDSESRAAIEQILAALAQAGIFPR